MTDPIRHHHRHNPTIGEIPVPHGPEVGNEHDHYPTGGATEQERAIFAHLTHPDDCYTEDGVYWADLPLRKRIAFVNKVQNEETKRELAAIGRMMKADPLSPVSWYFRNAVLPGAGLGLEGYVLFSIGNLEPLFRAAWPTCWGKNPTECDANWIASVTYLEVIGIMVGQTAVGVIGDWIGRRWGLIQDAAIMFVGLLMITASWGLNLNGWVICYAWSLFFYGMCPPRGRNKRPSVLTRIQASASAASIQLLRRHRWRMLCQLENSLRARTACTAVARSPLLS